MIARNRWDTTATDGKYEAASANSGRNPGVSDSQWFKGAYTKNDRCDLCGKHFISHKPKEIICSCDENYCHGTNKIEKTKLKEVIDYIRIAKIGDLIFRRNLMNFSKGYGSCFSNNIPSTVDNYRNYLTHAGYLRIKSPGAYEYMKEIPKDLTYTQLIKQSYPDSDWTKIR